MRCFFWRFYFFCFILFYFFIIFYLINFNSVFGFSFSGISSLYANYLLLLSFLHLIASLFQLFFHTFHILLRFLLHVCEYLPGNKFSITILPCSSVTKFAYITSLFSFKSSNFTPGNTFFCFLVLFYNYNLTRVFKIVFCFCSCSFFIYTSCYCNVLKACIIR